MASTSISVSPSAEKSRNWLELPPDLMASILQRLGSLDLLRSARKVCTTWRTICDDPSMWRVVDMSYAGGVNFDLEEFARLAVDLSSGQLMDFNIEYFGSDNLLHYIADRSSQLRQLRLVSCFGVSSEGLTEMVKKLPLLEELHLYYIQISKPAIEVIGRCCPHLRSFKLNSQGYEYPHIECDEEALAIADNMHGLRHLQLFGNKMTIHGLMAILKNCSHLESLDMRQCFNVAHLESDVVIQLSQQMKELRLPFDSTEDYEYNADIHDWDSFDEEEYPSGLSDIDIVTDDGDYYEFSGASDIIDDDDLYFD